MRQGQHLAGTQHGVEADSNQQGELWTSTGVGQAHQCFYQLPMRWHRTSWGVVALPVAITPGTVLGETA